MRARALGGLFSALSKGATPVLDLTDLLRAELVLAVSAFDHFIHEVARRGILEIYKGLRPPTPAYLKFEVSLRCLPDLVASPGDSTVLDQEIRVRHSWQSFQKPEKIAEAIRLVSAKSLWDEIAIGIAMPAKDVKARLSAIADRRDKIAHEADVDPTDPSRLTRWPIDVAETAEAVDFLEALGVAVVAVLTRP